MIDYHVHTEFSQDGKTAMAMMCQTAVDKNMHEICFTEHVDLGHPTLEFTLDYSAYLKEFLRLRQLFPKLRLRLGVEAGFWRKTLAQTIKDLRDLPFDFIIWSVHAVDGHDCYEDEYFHHKSKRRAYSRYLEEVYYSLKAFDDYSALGHLGYVARKAPYDDPCLRYADFDDYFDAILQKVIDGGHALELNCGGLRMGSEMLPGKDILLRYKELGGEYITFGSDAHCAEHLGFYFREAVSLLASLGFSYLTVYEKKKPIQLPIEKVLHDK